jgi:hypothetical protein
MPHRFTGRTHIEVFVSSWEIECCAPPPVIGELTSWALTFIGPSDTWPELDCDRAWHVERRGRSTWLVDGRVSARWSTHNGPPPEPGHAVARGSLHGGVHDEGPQTTGRVQRIRFATSRYRLVEPRTLEPVPGTLTLTDVSEAPSSLFFDFDSGGRTTGRQGDDQPMSLGVLLDMTVP